MRSSHALSEIANIACLSQMHCTASTAQQVSRSTMVGWKLMATTRHRIQSIYFLLISSNRKHQSNGIVARLLPEKKRNKNPNNGFLFGSRRPRLDNGDRSQISEMSTKIQTKRALARNFSLHRISCIRFQLSALRTRISMRTPFRMSKARKYMVWV